MPRRRCCPFAARVAMAAPMPAPSAPPRILSAAGLCRARCVHSLVFLTAASLVCCAT
ncbi:MAG: hypothetical protein QM765_24915 [Myxococcales bacterium]